MKIGILTFHRAINYGAVLQCYALSEVLTRLGHEVEVIDYRQPRVERTDRYAYANGERLKLFLKLHLRSWLSFKRRKQARLVAYRNFDAYINEYLRLSPLVMPSRYQRL